MSALTVRDLQKFVEGLLAPLDAAGVSASARKEMERLAGCLAPFQEATLVAFSDFLVNARQAVETGAWPTPGAKPAKAPRAAKAPKPTVDQMAQQIMALYERAAADPNLDFAVIDEFTAKLKPLGKGELTELAKQVDVTVAAKDTKDAILKRMADSIKDRKSRAERTSYGSERAEALR